MKESIATKLKRYRIEHDLTFEEIAGLIRNANGELQGIGAQVRRVCLTGGEPFLHPNLPELVEFLLGPSKLNLDMVHIETSGTLPIQVDFGDGRVWITCSPKVGYLSGNFPWIDEYKIVLSEQKTDLALLPARLEELLQGVSDRIPVYLQPENAIESLHAPNFRWLSEFVVTHPRYRLSLQLHKVLGVR